MKTDMTDIKEIDLQAMQDAAEEACGLLKNLANRDR